MPVLGFGTWHKTHFQLKAPAVKRRKGTSLAVSDGGRSAGCPISKRMAVPRAPLDHLFGLLGTVNVLRTVLAHVAHGLCNKGILRSMSIPIRGHGEVEGPKTLWIGGLLPRLACLLHAGIRIIQTPTTTIHDPIFGKHSTQPGHFRAVVVNCLHKIIAFPISPSSPHRQ